MNYLIPVFHPPPPPPFPLPFILHLYTIFCHFDFQFVFQYIWTINVHEPRKNVTFKAGVYDVVIFTSMYYNTKIESMCGCKIAGGVFIDVCGSAS